MRRSILDRRFTFSELLSRGWKSAIPMASALMTSPKAPDPSTFPRVSLSSGNSQSGSYERFSHWSWRVRAGSIWKQFTNKWTRIKNLSRKFRNSSKLFRGCYQFLSTSWSISRTAAAERSLVLSSSPPNHIVPALSTVWTSFHAMVHGT